MRQFSGEHVLIHVSTSDRAVVVVLMVLVLARAGPQRCALRGQRLAERCTGPMKAVSCKLERCKGTRNGIGSGEVAPLSPQERVTTWVLCERETQ